MTLVAVVALTSLSTPSGALLLTLPLNYLNSNVRWPETSGQAIVVLGGSEIETIYRAKHAARLQKLHELPILVTGANVGMIKDLRNDYGTKVTWVEPGATTTEENARFSLPLLKEAGISRILLVTDRVDMVRSSIIFNYYEFEVISSSSYSFIHGEPRVTDLVPGPDALQRSQFAIHEWIGIIWFYLKKTLYLRHELPK